MIVHNYYEGGWTMVIVIAAAMHDLAPLHKLMIGSGVGTGSSSYYCSVALGRISSTV